MHITGLEFDPRAQGGPSPLLAWLLRQREVSVRDAALAWTDELRAAPTVTLTQVDVKLENALGHHRFGATGVPPAALASPFDVRGDLTGIGSGEWQKARMEERFLSAELGAEAYGTYCRRVPMIVPFLHRL